MTADKRQETCRVVRYGVRLGELQGSEAGHTGTEAAASLSVIAVGTRIAATGLSGGSGGLKECSATTPMGVTSTSVLPTLTQPVRVTSKAESSDRRSDITMVAHL